VHAPDDDDDDDDDTHVTTWEAKAQLF